jgi:hypothetical protein
MQRTLTINNVYAKKHKVFEFDDLWLQVFGQPERTGSWLIWGAEKNGKTSFALQLANYLSHFDKVLYVTAEEGISKAFALACERAGVEPKNRNLKFLEYETIEELKLRLRKRTSARVIIMDNLTIYSDELKNGVYRQLLSDFDSKLFVFLAHEDRGQPYTATAKVARRLSKVIVHVKGLACTVSGRVPGGVLTVDPNKARLFFGNEISN